MNPDNPRVDRAIADALRGAASEPYRGSLDDLASRIDAAAVPLLQSRRDGPPRAGAWWDYPAEWARTLIPTGFAIAAASLVALWLMRPSPAAATQPAAPSPSAIVIAAGHGTPTDLVDRAVDELVGPATRPAPRKPR